MKTYINNSGKKVIIKRMPNPYLLNSYSYCKKRISLIKEVPETKKYLTELRKRLGALMNEIKRRNLLTTG